MMPMTISDRAAAAAAYGLAVPVATMPYSSGNKAMRRTLVHPHLACGDVMDVSTSSASTAHAGGLATIGRRREGGFEAAPRAQTLQGRMDAVIRPISEASIKSK
jgi:hypothetical protein